MDVPDAASKNSNFTIDQCQNCGVSLRRFPATSVKTIHTAEEVTAVFKEFSIKIEIGQKLCEKCRRKIVFHSSKKQKVQPEETLNPPSSNLQSQNVAQATRSQSRTANVPDKIQPPSQKTDSQSSSQSSTSDPTFRPKINAAVEVDCVLLPIQRCAVSEKYCCICGKISSRSRVSFEARVHCYQKMKIFIPNGARICSEHLLNNRIYQDDLNKIKVCSKSSQVAVTKVTRMIEGLTIESNKSLLNEAGKFQLSYDRLKTLTGLTSEELKRIRSWMKSSKDSHVRTVDEALITFLFKLRTGASNKNIATIFEFDFDQTVSDICSTVVESFEKDILPTRFGVKRDMTDTELKEARRNLIDNHTSLDARKLLKLRDDQLVLILDGTYVKHQKSSNNEYQRRSYSGQKKTPLIKPFTVSTTDGYVVDTCGPYEGTKNDAQITKMLLADLNSVFRLMKEGDVIIVDRGFRDVVKLLEDKGFTVMMPALKYKKKQLTTKEANASRLVTKLRWVIEAVHGQIKQKFKLLHHQLDNKLLPKAKVFCRIAFFLNNEFGKRFKTDDNISDEIISRILKPKFTENTLAKEVEDKNWSRKKKPFEKLNEDLKILFSGTCQLAMAISYLAETLDKNDELQIKYVKERENIIAVSVRSRHINSKTYKCYIDYKPNVDGIGGIHRYTCDCPNGLRTIGCCCHVAAIIYYLANARYHAKIFKPAEKLTTLFREEAVDFGQMEIQNQMDELENKSERESVTDEASQKETSDESEQEESRSSSDEDYDSD